jgi:hypothetical protein
LEYAKEGKNFNQMKTARFLLPILALIPFNSLASQEVQHAPTVEQCRADQRLWLSEIESNHGSDGLAFYELTGRWVEMFECQKVDPERHFSYYNTFSEIDSEQERKLEDFLRRHKLYGQFIAEDAQGKR